MNSTPSPLCIAAPRCSETIARVIDHALLHPALGASDLDAGLDLAHELNVWAVCVKPCDVKHASRRLERTSTLVCSVVAFPHGHSLTEVKVQEAKRALYDGAREIDFVVNVARAVAGDFDDVRQEMAAMQELILEHRATLKSIFENAYLDDATKMRLCQIAKALGVGFVKTSTGFAAGVAPQRGSGASIHDVQIMVGECAPVCQVKASGGIRSLEELERFLDAGASRIGTSATREIIAQARRRWADSH
jgi:deoxyribose-phosphate aldolase